MNIQQDETGPRLAMGGLVSLARTYRISVYDAAYLSLAMREGVPLATLDSGLAKAAKSAGVRLISAA